MNARKLAAIAPSPAAAVVLRGAIASRRHPAALLPAHVGGVVAAFAVLSAAEQEQLAALCKKLGLAQEGGY